MTATGTETFPGLPRRDLDSTIVCVLTRFGLNRCFDLIPTVRDYRRILREADEARIPGLLRSAFLVENPTSCFTLSIWRDSSSIAEFGSQVPTHVAGADRVFRRLTSTDGRPELWSTKWALQAASNNLIWDDFDLASELQR